MTGRFLSFSYDFGRNILPSYSTPFDEKIKVSIRSCPEFNGIVNKNSRLKYIDNKFCISIKTLFAKFVINIGHRLAKLYENSRLIKTAPKEIPNLGVRD